MQSHIRLRDINGHRTHYMRSAHPECRLFYEHTHSDSNVIDGMSERGLDDPSARVQGGDMLEADIPPFWILEVRG